MDMTITIPMRTVSLLNAREHWRKRNARAREQRGIARAYTAALCVPQDGDDDAYTITLTRFGPKMLDTDNLAGSFKHVRDGIADALGIDDGSDRLTWTYHQEKAREYGVRITIERTQPCPATTA